MSATSPACAIVRASFGDYLRDALPPPQRKMLRDHLADCAGCRAASVASDPTFRFARPLPLETAESVSAEETRDILAAVRTGVDLMRAERRLRRPSRRLRMGSAAAAAAAAAVLLSSGWGILGSRPVPVAAAGAGSATIVAAAGPDRISAAAPQPAAEADASALQPAALDGESPASPDATVYDWNPGAGREEPRVVWIVDRGLDI